MTCITLIKMYGRILTKKNLSPKINRTLWRVTRDKAFTACKRASNPENNKHHSFICLAGSLPVWRLGPSMSVQLILYKLESISQVIGNLPTFELNY